MRPDALSFRRARSGNTTSPRSHTTGEGDDGDTAQQVHGKAFVVELPPSTAIRIDAGMNRYVNKPSYAFPWHGESVPIPFHE